MQHRSRQKRHMLRKKHCSKFKKILKFFVCSSQSFFHQHVRRNLSLMHKRFPLYISGISKRYKLHQFDTNQTVLPSFIFFISSPMLFNWEGNRCKTCFDLMTPPWQLKPESAFAMAGMQMCACGQGRKKKKGILVGLFFLFKSLLVRNTYLLKR